MKILILSFYYPPDIGPGPVRACAIVDALQQSNNSLGRVEIEILTTFPNRYASFRERAERLEIHENVTIRRIKTLPHRNGFFDQCLTFLFYFLTVLTISSFKKPDVVFVTSSRLMSCFLGAVIARVRSAELYLDVRDIFSEAISPVLKKKRLLVILPFLKMIEKFCFCSATGINVVSEGFVDHVKEIAPNITPTVYTNGIDREFCEFNFQKDRSVGYRKILYVGNVGDGQALHEILPDVAQVLGDNVFFTVIGDGSRKKELTERIKTLGVKNIEFLQPVSRNQLFAFYREADFLFCHLNNFQVFNSVLPSKIFEYAATGKPILAGVSGYASNFLERNVQGVEIFAPLDVSGMLSALKNLESVPKHTDRAAFCDEFSREKISIEIAKKILDLKRS